MSIFTQTQARYADPLLDALDPERKYFRHRFYGDSCVSGGDGQILKDMSVLQAALGHEEGNPQGNNGNRSLWQRLQARMQPANVVNIMNSEIQVSRSLMERLVIVDDSAITYNAYKSKTSYSADCADNTIRVPQWVKDMRGDRELLGCLEIIQQLAANPGTDVTKDLQYIIDTRQHYAS